MTATAGCGSLAGGRLLAGRDEADLLKKAAVAGATVAMSAFYRHFGFRDLDETRMWHRLADIPAALDG